MQGAEEVASRGRRSRHTRSAAWRRASASTASKVFPNRVRDHRRANRAGRPRRGSGAARGWLVGAVVRRALRGQRRLAAARPGPGRRRLRGRGGLQFWQLYYVTTPHRWITLLIVFLDRERFGQRRGTFLGVAAARRRGLPGRPPDDGGPDLPAGDRLRLERLALRRPAPRRLPHLRPAGRPAPAGGPGGREVGDAGVPAVRHPPGRDARPGRTRPWRRTCGRATGWRWSCPAWLVVRDLAPARAGTPGRLTYLVSVSGLYLGLLWAVHERRLGLVLALATASALFHAIEYLALVSWSVRQRHAGDGRPDGPAGSPGAAVGDRPGRVRAGPRGGRLAHGPAVRRGLADSSTSSWPSCTTPTTG